jgi:D-alanine-D-alanine ligase
LGLKKPLVLILFSMPSPYLPNGKADVIGPESVLHRLADVEKAIQSLGYPVQTLEAKGELCRFGKTILEIGPQVIFNLCEEYHGQSRWEMNVAAILEILGIPFTGSSALTLGLSQDKAKTKAILSYHGLATPAHRLWVPGEDPSRFDLRFPLIVKPIREDASLGIDQNALVRDPDALARQIQKIYQDYHQPVLVEEYIDGRELNVSILGNENPKALPISEIDFSQMPAHLPKICSYAAKWLEDSPEFRYTIPRCPALLSPEEEKKVVDVSLRAYRIMECRDYARVDIRLSEEGIPFILEINANPDISHDAGMTRSAKAAGYTYPDFIGRILQLALDRNASGLSSPHPLRKSMT